MDEPRVQYSTNLVGSSYRRFLHADHQGSTIAHSDSSDNKTAINTYHAYGIPSTSNQGRFGYTGQIGLPELGLYHYKSRMYDPKLGRFLQTDPIFYADNMNMYAYVGNDPMNKIDPTGLTGECNPNAKSCHTFEQRIPESEYKELGGPNVMLVGVAAQQFVSDKKNSDSASPKTQPPQAPPGVNVNENIRFAYLLRARNPWLFKRLVQNKGPWDYKQYGRKYADFGNFNYGATGLAAGFSEDILLRMAGYAQLKAETSTPEWGNPWGEAPYGDDPADQEMIKRGFTYYYETRY